MIETILVLGAISLWLYRAERLLLRYMDRRAPELPPIVKSEGIPDDLVAYASSFNTEWAKQQTMDALYEQYAKLHDWQKVRVAIGLSSGTM